MFSNKPPIPKRCAAEIRGAQKRVVSARDSIIYGEYNAQQSAERVAEFELDPQEFARTRYPGFEVESYPVQTTIERERERLAYNIGRHSARLSDLDEAVELLDQVEIKVLKQVENMRSTSGRVPWPTDLPSYSHYSTSLRRSFERTAIRAKQSAERRKVELDRQYYEELEVEAKRQQQNDVDYLNVLNAIRSKQTPEEREVDDLFRNALSAAIRDKAISALDVINGRVKYKIVGKTVQLHLVL
jgi:hypothetical protein